MFLLLTTSSDDPYSDVEAPVNRAAERHPGERQVDAQPGSATHQPPGAQRGRPRVVQGDALAGGGGDSDDRGSPDAEARQIESTSAGSDSPPQDRLSTVLRENLSGLPRETEEQRRFSARFMEVVRQGTLRSDVRDCLTLILELRNVQRALVVLEIHYRRDGDEFETELEAVRTDAFSLEETDCLLDSAMDLSDLPVPTWIPDGAEHVVTFPFDLRVTD